MRTAKFVPGETCIILDEIQDCPEARTSLKFFKEDGRRIHFASAMSLLGLDDGAGSSTGNGYLDIVDFILQGCVDVQQNLSIDQYTEQSDATALLQASGSYMLEQREASEIIEEVRTAIKDWRKTATELQISHKILESYCNRWDNL